MPSTTRFLPRTENDNTKSVDGQVTTTILVSLRRAHKKEITHGRLPATVQLHGA